MDRDEFFVELDRLSEKEIEARLASWGRDQLLLVQEYLDQRRSQGPQADAVAAKEAASAAAQMASRANDRATVAFIISIGAMLAAITATVVALLGLRYE
jgi:hypothetical protein